MGKRVVIRRFVVMLFVVFLAPGCSSSEPTAAETTSVALEPTETSGPKEYEIPEEEASNQNPILADEASVQRGKEIYQATCVGCHGEKGYGDGLAAGRLNPPPADFRAVEIIALSDGELFYLITNGVEGTAMRAHNFFEDDQRWHLVNYIRSIQE